MTDRVDRLMKARKKEENGYERWCSIIVFILVGLHHTIRACEHGPPSPRPRTMHDALVLSRARRPAPELAGGVYMSHSQSKNSIVQAVDLFACNFFARGIE